MQVPRQTGSQVLIEDAEADNWLESASPEDAGMGDLPQLNQSEEARHLQVSSLVQELHEITLQLWCWPADALPCMKMHMTDQRACIQTQQAACHPVCNTKGDMRFAEQAPVEGDEDGTFSLPDDAPPAPHQVCSCSV